MTHEAEQALDGYLIALVQGGSSEAFDRLVQRWTPKLLRYATRVLGRPEPARDIVQETWIGVMRGLRRLEDPAQFPAWIYSIAHRKCIDGIRVNQRARRLAARVGRESAVAAESTQDGVDPGDHTGLAKAISHLSQDLRDTVYLFYGEELSISEIAAILSVPAGTVKSRLHHARQSLRHSLGE